MELDGKHEGDFVDKLGLLDEYDKAKERLKEVDESIQKLIGRDANEPRFGQRRPSLGMSGGRDASRIYEAPGWRPGGGFISGPPRRGRGAFNRLGGRLGRPRQDPGSDDEPENKPSVQSSIVQSISSEKSREQKLAEENRDSAGKARNKRMFGMLLGTLQQFKSDSQQDQTLAASLQRRSVDQKLEQKAEAERLNRIKEREDLFNQRKQQRAQITHLERRIELVDSFKQWETETLKLMNFVRTRTKPVIFYLPKNAETVVGNKMEETKKYVADLISRHKETLKVDLDQLAKTYEVSEDKKDDQDDSTESRKSPPKTSNGDPDIDPGHREVSAPQQRSRGNPSIALKEEFEEKADEEDAGDAAEKDSQKLRKRSHSGKSGRTHRTSTGEDRKRSIEERSGVVQRNDESRTGSDWDQDQKRAKSMTTSDVSEGQVNGYVDMKEGMDVGDVDMKVVVDAGDGHGVDAEQGADDDDDGGDGADDDGDDGGGGPTVVGGAEVVEDVMKQADDDDDDDANVNDESDAIDVNGSNDSTSGNDVKFVALSIPGTAYNIAMPADVYFNKTQPSDVSLIERHEIAESTDVPACDEEVKTELSRDDDAAQTKRLTDKPLSNLDGLQTGAECVNVGEVSRESVVESAKDEQNRTKEDARITEDAHNNANEPRPAVKVLASSKVDSSGSSNSSSSSSSESSTSGSSSSGSSSDSSDSEPSSKKPRKQEKPQPKVSEVKGKAGRKGVDGRKYIDVSPQRSHRRDVEVKRRHDVSRHVQKTSDKKRARSPSPKKTNRDRYERTDRNQSRSDRATERTEKSRKRRSVDGSSSKRDRGYKGSESSRSHAVSSRSSDRRSDRSARKMVLAEDEDDLSHPSDKEKADE